MTRPVLRLGSTGSDVALWQRLIGLVPADGIFGRQTEGATKAWQARNQLTPDGIVGPASWATVSAPEPIPLKPLVRGCDVSAIQGALTAADWMAMKAAGLDFAYMRLAVGNETWVDGRARANAQLARAHGITPGYYVFPYPLPHLDPKTQVERFVRLLEQLGTRPGELPPMFDLEWPPPEEWKKWRCSAVQLREWGLTALERGEELTGVEWPVYLYRWWARMAEIEKAPEYGRRPLVIADYKYSGVVPTAEQIEATPLIKPWSRESLMIVQHDGDGGLRLPNGRDADFDVMPGGPEALARWSRGASSPSLPVPASEPRLPSAAPSSASDLAGAVSTDTIRDHEIAAYRRCRQDVDA